VVCGRSPNKNDVTEGTMIEKISVLGAVAASVGLGLYMLFGAFQVLFQFEHLFPDIAAAHPNFVAQARSAVPLDIVSGLLLVAWPFYLFMRIGRQRPHERK
jgi:hypothetical protein